MKPDLTSASDVFDATDDGYAPRPVLEVAAAARRAAEALEDLQLALHGSMTPLNLREAARDISHAQALVQPHADLLTGAAHAISSGAPLARMFRDDPDPWMERSDDASGQIPLSPKQVLALAAQARELLPSATITYAQAMAGGSTVPPLIAGLRRAAERNRLRDEAEALIEAILLDMESRACERCGAGPGEYCTSSGGKVTDPHAARRHASPLAAEHKGIAKYAHRTDPDAAWNKPREAAEPAEHAENREMVSEVIEMMSEKFTDLDR